jgi:hypothetical protein
MNPLFSINIKSLWNCIHAHKTNLAVEVLSELPIVRGIEDLLQDIYSFFCKTPKKHVAFMKLVEFLEYKGNKILRCDT